MRLTRFAIPATVLLVAACSGTGGATTAPSKAPTTSAPSTASAAPAASATTAATAPATTVAPSQPAVTPAPSVAATPLANVCANLPAGSEGDLLATICQKGTITMSTDPAYPPQSELAPDDPLGYKGFDIDVGAEIAKRLGVKIAFQTPDWEVITAGSWGGRWDFSVGSMTITSARQLVLDFTEPYYFTPAQMAVRSDSDITSLDGLAGKVICVGQATTYLDWINGTLDFGTESPQTQPPAGSTAQTLKTDRDCAVAWKAGRHDFDGWLSSATTVQQAVDDGLPVKAIGDPVFYEPLAVAFDKTAPTHAMLVQVANQIVVDMHADGTLTALSNKWFGSDLTVKVEE